MMTPEIFHEGRVTQCLIIRIFKGGRWFAKFMREKMGLPLDKRYEIVFLHEHPAGPKWGYKRIAKEVKCDKRTVMYWLERYHENPDLNTAEKPGRPRVTTAKQDKQIVKMAEKEHNITATEIQKRMEERDVEISVATVKRRLREGGGKFTNEILKPLLTDDHRRKRLQWAKDHQNFDWNRVIFTDESTFQLYSSKKKVWQEKSVSYCEASAESSCL